MGTTVIDGVARRWRAAPPMTRAGLDTSALAAAILLGWVAGWAWLAATSALALFAVAAATAGVDSRARGDWTRVEGP